MHFANYKLRVPTDEYYYLPIIFIVIDYQMEYELLTLNQ